MLPDVGITKGTCTLWQEELLLDYTIEVEKKQFKVHKVIMASVSDYFKAMLTGGMVESQTNTVRLEGQNALAVSGVIEYVYTGQFGTTKASPEEPLACAVYLQIPAAITACTDLLCNKLDKHNCLDILSLFRSYSLKDGIRSTTEYIRCNRVAILEVTKADDVRANHGQFLDLTDTLVMSEWELFLHVKRCADVKLLIHIRFALMTPEQLKAIKDMDIYSNSEGLWRELVVKAEEYHKLPTHQKVLDDSEQSRMRQEPAFVCFTTDDEGRFSFHPSDNEEQKQYESTQTPTFVSDAGRVFEVNNFLLGIQSDGSFIFDPRTKKRSPMANVPNEKSGMAIVYCNKYLYALGGWGWMMDDGVPTIFSTDCIRRYAFETNKWTVLPTKLPKESTHLGAGVINGNIYVAAAHQTDEGCTELDCYKPSTDTWCSKAPMLKPNYYDCSGMQVLELWNEEVLFVMRQGFNMQYYSPSTDQWSIFNPLPYVDTHLVYNNDGRVHARGNSLYYFDFLCEVADINGKYIGNREETTEGTCARWTFHGQKISENMLEDLECTSHVSALITI